MEQIKIKNKKILFIAPFFFGYEVIIKEELQRQGAIVDMFNERPVERAISRAFLKVFPFLFCGVINRYYKSILSEHHNYDYILIIGCDSITKKALRMIKRANPNAKMCLHLMDSVKNIKFVKKKFVYFDYCSSFDRKDCESFNCLNFRPLFYSKCFEKNGKEPAEYDICFCGTVHSDRYYVIKKIESGISKKRVFFKHLYLQAPFMFYFYKLFGKGFLNSKKNEFSFRKMSLSEIALVENKSSVILDIQHPKQSGLTMRTLEILGSRKKMITTNKDVVNYDFYNPNNIFVINREKPTIDESFFEKEYVPLSNEIYKKYSLEQWVLDVLGV